MTRTIGEQITALENTRSAKTARQQNITEASIDEGRAMDAAEAEEFDAIEAEVEQIDASLVRLRRVEANMARNAQPITNYSRGGTELVPYTNGNGSANGANGQTGQAGQQPRPYGTIRVVEEKLEPGCEFARMVMCLAAARGNLPGAAQMAANHYGQGSDLHLVLQSFARLNTMDVRARLQLVDGMKAAVGSAVISDDNWAKPLVALYPRFTGDFVDYLRPRTILGNITGLRRVPFNVNIAGQTSGASASWVGEAKPKPLTQFSFTSTNLPWAKIATIAVISEELARFSQPSAETYVRDELTAAVAERMDVDFVNPAKAAVANVSPASVTNGVTPIHSNGNDGDRIRQDIEAMFAVWDDFNLAPTNPVFIMSGTKARQLTLMRNALGQQEFPGMRFNGTGGTLEGIPVVSSQYVTRFGTTGGEIVVLLAAEEVWFSDDGDTTVDASREASLEMSDSPTQDGSGGTGASLVSMFQNNLIAIRAERFVNWMKRRPPAAVVLDQVFWGSTHVSGT